MMEDVDMDSIKKYFKMIKYGLQVRTMIILTVIFFVLGIIYELIDFNSNGIIPFSGLYLGIAGTYIYSVLMTPTVSALIQTSAMKRKLQGAVPAIFAGACTLITFTVFMLLRFFVGLPRLLKADPGADTTIIYVNTFCTAVLLAVLFIYYSFNYRYYVVSTVALCLVLIPTLFIFIRIDWPLARDIFKFISGITEAVGGGAVIALSYVIILIGIAMCYGFNLLLYRKPISALAYRAALRQAESK